MDFLDRALILAKSSEDTEEQAQVLIRVAHLKMRIGEYTKGQTLSIEAQRLAKVSTDLYLEARAVWTEAVCCRELGYYKHSISLLHRGKEFLRLCGMAGGRVHHMIMNDEAEVHLLKSEYLDARSIHLQIAQHTAEDQDTYAHAIALLNIGQIDLEIGASEHDVHHNVEKAKVLLDNVKYSLGVQFCYAMLAVLQLREGETMVAKALFQRCLHFFWAIYAEGVLYCLEKMADIKRWSSTHFHWTSTHTVVYLAFANKSQIKLALYKALQCLGDVFLTNGDTITAENLFIVALEGLTHMDIHRSRAECLLRTRIQPRQKYFGKKLNNCLGDHPREKVLLKLMAGLLNLRGNIKQKCNILLK